MALFLNGKQVRGSLIVEGDLTMPLPTVDTASGSVASFDTDLTENLIECVCDIQYQQAEGTPTPDNPIPIQVFDSLTLYHNDINMWDEQWEAGQYDATNGQKINTPVANASIRCKNYIPCIPDTNYFVLVPYSSVITGFCAVFFYDSSKTFISKTNVKSNGVQAVITTPNNAHYITFFVSSLYGTTYNNDISINYPSTDTQYHAFNGAYIPFGQTVAKGTLNVTTGVLIIYWVYGDLGSYPWRRASSGNIYYLYTNISDIINPSTYDSEERLSFACDIYKKTTTLTNAVSTTLTDNYSCVLGYNSGCIIIRNDDYSDTDVFKTAMSGKQIVYKLATPITVQLTPTEVKTLLGENNIWCDTNGDTRVKFLLTVGKKIA